MKHSNHLFPTREYTPPFCNEAVQGHRQNDKFESILRSGNILQAFVLPEVPFPKLIEKWNPMYQVNEDISGFMMILSCRRPGILLTGLISC